MWWAKVILLLLLFYIVSFRTQITQEPYEIELWCLVLKVTLDMLNKWFSSQFVTLFRNKVIDKRSYVGALAWHSAPHTFQCVYAPLDQNSRQLCVCMYLAEYIHHPHQCPNIRTRWWWSCHVQLILFNDMQFSSLDCSRISIYLLQSISTCCRLLLLLFSIPVVKSHRSIRYCDCFDWKLCKAFIIEYRHQIQNSNRRILRISIKW